jgi:DNA-directed RNA polymerase specialized sigma24 family protein
MEKTTLVEDVLDTVQALPEPFRETFLLHADGIACGEIAERLEVTDSCIRLRLKKARFLIERRLLKRNPKRYEGLFR